jgi:PAS domain S-box-containing protein
MPSALPEPSGPPTRSPRAAPPPAGLDDARTRAARTLGEMADELARTRAALRESEDGFRMLVASIPGAVYRRALDPDLTIGFVSDAVAQISGHDPASLTGNRDLSWAGVVHPDDREAIVEEMRAAVRDGRHYGLAYRIVRTDGEEAWVGDRGQAAMVGDDGTVWVCGMLTDITARKRLEADRLRMERELRTAQKLEAVGQLAAGIAHEINTPVQFIGDSVRFLHDAFADLDGLLAEYRAGFDAAVAGGDAGALGERLEEAEDLADLEYLRERVPAALHRTLEGVERVASIVRAMKEFAHPQTAQAPADLNRALASTLTVARNEYKYVADVETAFGDLPPVVCNLSDIGQVFLNLIINAAHAIEDAHGDGGEKGVIRVSTAVEDDTAVVAIADTGCGIPDEIRTRVFDPFFTTKELGRGSGQGLALSRAIVEKHGGSLAFLTEPGKGTAFTLRLPIAGAPDVVAAA